ncbi:Hypothetical Protein FCC1311_074932 [Hondaea fermentalgiana]|uniref:Uncharacterized protein n=1 Tax=Hondaea fermentalgiana TaxID=2315210 RepID=A0A2R5GK41_9STRA|nr:Hypothetical Protein FCC1311_074932 [Hondaea fermentalgiana]|eukprot:GBG31272.1 Hypothetical Protein FCC1311_074932 [Hondaea fermentalgiana]
MLQLALRPVDRTDVAALGRRAGAAANEGLRDGHFLVSLACTAAAIAGVVAWMRQPVDPSVLQLAVGIVILATMYRPDSAQAAKREALRQMQAALSYFVAAEREIFREVRTSRNALAQEFNILQQQIDDHGGWWRSWTSFLRYERIIRDTSTLEHLALRTSNAVGSALSGPLAESLVQTRGFGPIVFVCLASPVAGQTQRQLALALLASPQKPPMHLRVFGIYFFGTLVTRFSAAHAVVSLFPDTIESPRIVDMRADLLRLQALVKVKKHELKRITHGQLRLEHPLRKTQTKKKVPTNAKTATSIPKPDAATPNSLPQTKADEQSNQKRAHIDMQGPAKVPKAAVASAA